MSWTFTEGINPDGFGIFAIRVWSTDRAGAWDVTFFRDTPASIDNLTWADPFGPATARITFPQCTGFDPPSGDTWWLREFINVDIVWIPASATTWEGTHGHVERQIINPMTNSTYLYLHEYQNTIDPTTGLYEYQPSLWEGFIVSLDPSVTGVAVELQGALYQLDRYYAKPLYPFRPKFIEDMIARYFDPRRRGLWTQPLKIDYTGWDKVYDQYAYNQNQAKGGIRFQPTPVVDSRGNYVDQNVPWLGYITRDTGNWEKALTGYIQSQLGVMFAKPDSKLDTEASPPEVSWGADITDGDQWTITMDPGRQPRLYLRRQNKAPTLVAYYGQPGVDCQMTRDGNQSYDVVFAQGKGPDDNAWSTQVMVDSYFSTWEPLTPVADADGIYVGNLAGNDLRTNYDGYNAVREREEGIWVAEKMIPNFPSGIDYADAQHLTKNWVARDSDPGWAGTITLQCDLRDAGGTLRSRWTIRDGDVLLLKGFRGEMDEAQGVNKFHVNQVEMRPMDGSVILTVDSKFRDLLSVEWSIAAGRDTLSPIKALQVGKRSTIIQDLGGPWNVRAGSGCIPRQSIGMPDGHSFPYVDVTSVSGNRPNNIFKPAYLPGGSGVPVTSPSPTMKDEASLDSALASGKTLTDAWYVPVHAGANKAENRWAVFPILLSSAGTITRTEMAAYTASGQLAPVEFFFAVWGVWHPPGDMPYMPVDDPLYPGDNRWKHAALFPGAFEAYDTEGKPYADQGPRRGEHPDMFNGWGTYESPCGYGRGHKTGTNTPDGTFIDSAPWTFNMNYNADYTLLYSTSNTSGDPSLSHASGSAVSAWVTVYAIIPEILPDGWTESLDWVYFRGRVFREVNIGTGS